MPARNLAATPASRITPSPLLLQQLRACATTSNSPSMELIRPQVEASPTSQAFRVCPAFPTRLPQSLIRWLASLEAHLPPPAALRRQFRQEASPAEFQTVRTR